MSSDDTPINPAYPDGLDGILNQMNARRAPLGFAKGEALPPLDCDLEALAKTTIAAPRGSPASKSEHARKSWEIARELKGKNALLHLNGVLIAHLRKQSQPDHTARLFVRLWAEHSDLLLSEMDMRWKVSSLTTFGDHGTTVHQRSAGLGLSTLFGTMKLYESERLYSGRESDRPFTLDGRSRSALPLDMNAYSLDNGGLDVNMIGRLWEEAAQDKVIRPLGHDMLQRLIDDPRTVFRRLHRLRVRKQRRMEQATPKEHITGVHVPVPKDLIKTTGKPPSWGVVCTTNAPLLDVARFVAHHLDLGAKRIFLYLDAPDPDVVSLLDAHDKIDLTVCDDAYWTACGKARMDTHQIRQAHNATRALGLAKGQVDWLGHIDTDEFVLCNTKFSTALRKVPDDIAAVRLFPAEALASTQPGFLPTRFKLRTNETDLSSDVVHEIYPTFGSYLRGGFLSHTAGKVFARTGLDDTRLKIHRLRYQGQDVSNIADLPDTYVGHLHAPDWDSFFEKLVFRKTMGSYRIRPDEPPKSVGRLLNWLHDEEGEDGLRMFFDEMCLDTADLRTRLDRHGLLYEPEFDPDSALERVFGIRLGG
jgi:hypothetical protein